jgi:biopolymer transport protein ExbB/TolQ
LISSLCTVFDFFSVLFLISSLYCFSERRNQKQYREEIKNSTEKKSKTVQREEIKNNTEKKSKTVQRRNQKQYREEIKKNSTEKKLLFLISSLYCF